MRHARALAALVAATAAAGAAAAPAHATLVYVKNLGSLKFQPSVWSANDDGSSPHRIASGTNPRVSPDGTMVVYATNPTKPAYRSALRVAPTAGGPSRVLLTRVDNTFSNLAWAPDSKHVAALTGPELGPHRLVVIDPATAAQRTVDTGFFSGVSFSPDSARLVYGRWGKDDFEKSDLFVAGTAAGAPTQITTDHRAFQPLWGPAFIAFAHAKPRKGDYAVLNIWRIAPDGSGRTAITHNAGQRLLAGLTPTAFSADGSRLLAEFGGQDTSYGVTVDPATGKQRVISPRREYGWIGSGISRNGTTLLVATGGFDPSTKSDVITIPYGGGARTILVRNAAEPDWNR